MNLVAITRLATPIELEARALAADLGTLAYEERQKLAAGVPAIVLSTPDADHAAALVAKLRARGHDAQICRASDVVAAGAMISMRRFRLDDDAIVAPDRDARLPWAGIATFVRATRRTRTEETAIVKHKKLDLGRAVVTGGLIMRSTSKTERVIHRDDSELVLYLFRGDGETPWLLTERGTHFRALGSDVATVAAKNFEVVVDQLRARAPHARFDDRLVARKAQVDDLDLLAHLIAIAP